MFEEMTLDATRPTHLLGAVYGGNEVVVHLHHSHSSLSSHTVEYALLCVCVFGALKVNGSTVWFGVHVMLYSYPSPGCVTVIRNPLFFDLHCSGGALLCLLSIFCFFVLYLSFCCSGATSHCWLSHSTHRKGHTHTHSQGWHVCVLSSSSPQRCAGVVSEVLLLLVGFHVERVGRDTHGECSHKKPTKALYLVSMPIWAPKKKLEESDKSESAG